MRTLLIVFTLFCLAADGADSLLEIYREAKAALEAGEAEKAIALLESALHDAKGGELAPAQLALGVAYLRVGKAEAAVPFLEKASVAFAGTPQVASVLASLGDALRVTGEAETARRVYKEATEAAPDSVNAKYVLARIAEMDGEKFEAEKEYSKAAERYLAAGDALLALAAGDAGYYKAARVLYEKVAKGSEKAAPGKDWRGEPTARAVFSIGEVERAQGHLPEAIAFYQRTFVSWLKYPHWCAQAYLRAAECMEKLGKRDFAKAHLREMIRKHQKFGKLPEYEQAKKQLRAWGDDIR
jgi:tetratricopeptide (TPR) repeat protein